MAQLGSSLLKGTTYEINKGKAMIGGIVYDVTEGVTMVGGIVYRIAAEEEEETEA